MHFYPDATVPARVLCGALSIRARKP
jgi:hypothetical protein